MDKSLKLLRSKNALKWKGSNTSIHSVHPAVEDVNTIVDDSSPPEVPRSSGRQQSPPRAAWDEDLDQPLSIKGQRAPMKSPRQVTSPNAASRSNMMSPRSHVTSPRSSVTSPRASVTSPRASVTSPRASVTSPRASVTSPRASVTSSKSCVASPRPNMTPRSSTTSMGSADHHRVTPPRSSVQRSQSMDHHILRRNSHRAVHPENSVSTRNGQRTVSQSDHVISPRINDTLKHAGRGVSPKSGYRSQSIERVTSPKDTSQDTHQQQHTNQSVSMSVDKPKFLEYLVNEAQTEIKTSPRGRLRKHFSRLKTRVSSASPSYSNRYRQERILPDDYINPNQDPETMVSRQSPKLVKNRPHSTTSVGLLKRSESVCNEYDSARDAYLYLKSVTSSFNMNGQQHEQNGPHEHHKGQNRELNGHSNEHQNATYQHNNRRGGHQNRHQNFHQTVTLNEKLNQQTSHQNVRQSNQHVLTPCGIEAQALGFTGEACQNSEQEASSEVQDALKSLALQPRHVRRSSSAVDAKKDARKPVCAANYKNAKTGDSADLKDHKDEVSRQLKQFAQNSGHFKAGPHFQHLYLKRAESIVQKQILQKAQSPKLHIKVPQAQDLELNTYATDVPDSPKVPVLRMTVAKVKGSPSSQPVKTYIQVGKTVKEASFNTSNKHFTESAQTTNTPKQKVNHLIVLPSHNCETKEDSSSRSRVHFMDSVVSEPQHMLTHSKSSILKKTNEDAYNDAHSTENVKDQTDLNSQDDHNGSTVAVYESKKDSNTLKHNRGTAIIAVHQDADDDKPKTALRKYSTILATEYGLLTNTHNVTDSVEMEASSAEMNGSSIAESASKDEHVAKSEDKTTESQDGSPELDQEAKLQESPEHEPTSKEQSTPSEEQVVARFQVGSPKPTKVVRYHTTESAKTPKGQSAAAATLRHSREEISVPKSSSTTRNHKDDKQETPKARHKSPVSILRHLKDDTTTTKETKPRGLQRRRSQKVHALPSDGPSILSPRRQSVKKKQECMDIVEDKQVKVDHSLMVDYLTLVKESPEEYVTMQHCPPASRKPVKSIVGMASVFRRGHHEKVGPPESIVVQAAYELGSKTPHPVCVRYEKLERQRVEIATKASMAVTKMVNKRHQQEALDMLGQQAEQLNELTPMEKSRAKLEIWLRGLSAAQQIKVKELALKEMGEEAHSIRKWWLAHKYCKYLRQKTKPD